MFNAVSNALSGLTASSQKVSVAASNIANVSTSGSLSGDTGNLPYATKLSTQTAIESGGVRTDVTTKNPGFVPSYAPDSPFADTDGLIGVPNTDLAEEIVNLKQAEITYKANAKSLQIASELSDELLRLFDDNV